MEIGQQYYRSLGKVLQWQHYLKVLSGKVPPEQNVGFIVAEESDRTQSKSYNHAIALFPFNPNKARLPSAQAKLIALHLCHSYQFSHQLWDIRPVGDVMIFFS